MRVVGEQCLLALGVAAIGAVRVRVDELSDRQPVSLLGGRDLCVVHGADAAEVCRHVCPGFGFSQVLAYLQEQRKKVGKIDTMGLGLRFTSSRQLVARLSQV